MAIRYKEIADRLRAFRLGSGMSADEIARRLGISRTALYRFEKGELAKIETLEKLSELLQVSMPTLLGVGIEYMPSAVSYFERMRQFEENAERIMILAGPISFLLASEQFSGDVVKIMLKESIPGDVPDRERTLAQVEQILDILDQRKKAYLQRRPGIVNLISAREVARLLATGFVGNSIIRGEELARRRRLAREEIEHFAQLIEQESIGVQIGLVTETLPHTGFQIFRMADSKVLTISPFRLGEQTNVRLGVAMITSAPDAIALHERIVHDLWRNALKGAAAAERLRSIIDATVGAPEPKAKSRQTAKAPADPAA